MIASLSNDDGDVNENCKRAVGLDRGGSRGRVQGVRTLPPRDDLRFSNTTGILQKKNYVVYWC